MALTDEFDLSDLQELARIEGKTVDEVKRELLRERLLRGKGGSAEPARPARPAPPAPLARASGLGDASGAAMARSREEAIQRHHAQEYAGSPVVRYDRDPYNETPEEAQERWYEEEASLL